MTASPDPTVTGVDPSLIGAKAAGLARLEAAGFNVPAGLVFDAATLSEWPPGEAAPEPVRSAARETIARFGGVPLAVRSSAVDEDGLASSFAGLYNTTLDVSGVDDVLTAIEVCLSSRFAAPAAVYRGAELRAWRYSSNRCSDLRWPALHSPPTR